MTQLTQDIKAGDEYSYNVEGEMINSKLIIERVHDGIAYATSGSFGDMGPFTMTFNASTGRGTGLYKGTYLLPITK